MSLRRYTGRKQVKWSGPVIISRVNMFHHVGGARFKHSVQPNSIHHSTNHLISIN